MYAIIGDGRVARHVAHYFRLEQIEFTRWSRNPPAESPSPDWRGDLEEALRGASHVLVLISDGAIEEFLRSRPLLREKIVVHFSGSLVSPLAPSAHPLMTFSTELYDLETYRSIPFILEEGREPFDSLLPGLRNRHFYIQSEMKARYHSLCVLSGNFTTILWNKFFQELAQTFEIPADSAYPYLRKTAENLEDLGGAALTGPLARGDSATIQRNLEALLDDPFEGVYRAFVEAMDPMRREEGKHA